jgi:hypothetical protein
MLALCNHVTDGAAVQAKWLSLHLAEAFAEAAAKALIERIIVLPAFALDQGVPTFTMR